MVEIVCLCLCLPSRLALGSRVLTLARFLSGLAARFTQAMQSARFLHRFGLNACQPSESEQVKCLINYYKSHTHTHTLVDAKESK